ncbi:hypothetical protein GALMADRAFT_110089 [Galerina marginata CBS 339.88]|uniref:Rab proteins geranylgeranyltransferase n=1 Tax=Galerina marginata (strain CBS 339.88) TaxID=685588 RepID=A0A067TK64_GALM3|nr:hypothetical protein GALMADRAFT_110089 [Galerina marginata CBS 339.88]
MEESQFDVVVFGTGLVESITAAALSKAGYKVAHIDSNPYYGGDEASLSVDDLVQWADKPAPSSGPPPRFQRIIRSQEIPPQSRQYSICLQPAVITSLGYLISSLIMSGVAKYSGFRLLDSVSVYHSSGCVKNVPGSKEDIFKSKDISLIEKRRLMRFLTFASTDFTGKKELEGEQDVPFIEFLQSVFSLSQEISSTIAYSLAFCMAASEPTLPSLQRLQSYLRSSGRYGSSPFLIGHYGGIGDIAQGFCRAAAVSGGVYILNRNVTGVSRTKPTSTTPNTAIDTSSKSKDKLKKYSVDLEDFPDTLSCDLIISSSSYVPPSLQNDVRILSANSVDKFKSSVTSIARCIAIIDQALTLRSREQTDSSEHQTEREPDVPRTPAKDNAVDAAILVFPPASVPGGSTTHSATVLINGEGSLSTPKGKWLLYIALPLTAELDASPDTLLTPYLDALCLLSADPSMKPIKPLFTVFYLEIPAPPSFSGNNLSQDPRTYLVIPPVPIATLPDIPDAATRIAEHTFMEAAKILRTINKPAEESESEDLVFWPPLPVDEEDEDIEW